MQKRLKNTAVEHSISNNLVEPSPTQLYCLLNLYITHVKLLYSWMENTVIQHTFLKFDQSKKTDYQWKSKNPRWNREPPDLVKKKQQWQHRYEHFQSGQDSVASPRQRWADSEIFQSESSPDPIQS